MSVLNLLFAMSYGPSTGARSRDRAGHPDFMPFRLDPFYEPLHNAALKFPQVELTECASLLPVSRGLSELSWLQQTIATHEPHGGGDRLDTGDRCKRLAQG